MKPPHSVTVLTHSRPEQTAAALGELIAAARRVGTELRFDPDETAKHRLAPSDGVIVDAEVCDDVELCVVLGGDGTILKGLRRYAGTGIPTFAVNFGEVGFLATLDPEELGGVPAEAFDRAFSGDFQVLRLPAIATESEAGRHAAINDVSIHRKVGERIALLAYGVGGEELGSVRCDGIVLCTAAGSTGYNLANGGPVLAWGVEGYGVSFIAPHSLTARALVVAPGDELRVQNGSREPVEVSVDGRPAGELGPGAELRAHFQGDVAALAQIPGWSFYRRLRTKFGRLA
jgi:NAD+ kinase